MLVKINNKVVCQPVEQVSSETELIELSKCNGVETFPEFVSWVYTNLGYDNVTTIFSNMLERIAIGI